MNFVQLNKKLFRIFVISTTIIILVLIGIDIKGFSKALKTFNVAYLPIILLLIFLNYLFRYLKWKFYLKCAKIETSLKDSIKIFLAAIPMTITPGKVGEALKAYVLKAKYNYPISYSLPVVVVERMTDALGMIILAGIGALIFNSGVFILGVFLLLVLGIILCLQNKTACYVIINILRFIPFIRRYAQTIASFYENIYNLLKMKVLIVGVLIGIVSWGTEGLIVYFSILGAGANISIIYSIFILALSSILGVVSMIPGGVVVSEGSILTMLIKAGIDNGRAGLIVLLIRISTLWIGVVFGSMFLLKVEKELYSSGFKDFEIEGELLDNTKEP